jgi:glucosamine--fructose-6-phosphate aminotransferase (isomerizing)
MCGIVGHIGPGESVAIVLEGLKRLEYRGYDSAGICFQNNRNEIPIYKKTGKLQNLVDFLKEQHIDTDATMCIGHTRWATHGGVTDTNAHPHLSDTMATNCENSVAIVHNGIIENAEELKEELIRQGICFRTETDSEVFLGLLLRALEKTQNVHLAIAQAFEQVRGNSAFVIQIKGHSEIIAIKRGAPLVCGSSSLHADLLVSSDPYALIGAADKIYFPEDSVLCSLSHTNGHSELKFYELDGSVSHRVATRSQTMSLEATDKGHFEHFMLKEIHEQPKLIRSFAQYYAHDHEGRSALEAIADQIKPSRIIITACGTAWHAGLVIRNILETENRIPCMVELASEFRYRNPILTKNDLAVFISQSGETADTLAAMTLCKEEGIPTLSIVNVEGSTLYRNAGYNLLIKAGPEIGVASTKAFTLQALTGYLMAQVLGDKHHINKKTYLFNVLADRIQDLLDSSDRIRSIAEEIHGYKGFIFTGRGVDYPIALEGALKLKEIAYVHAEGYASGELKHGPIALIDPEIVNIAIVSPKLYEKTVSNIQEVKARRGIIVTIGPKGDTRLEKLSDYYIPLDFEGLDESLAPLFVNVATQLLAYYMAKYKGTDIDKPRNLAKSVTVE